MTGPGAPLLQAAKLTVSFAMKGLPHPILRQIDLSLNEGETLAVVGESGSGKTTLLHALLGLLPEHARVTAGAFQFLGKDLLQMRESDWSELRGRRAALVSQDPGKAWNPTRSLSAQFQTVLRGRMGMSKKAALQEASRLLERVHLSDALLARYPHELSGGERQRAMIALALSQKPKVLLTDEPTTALDVTLQAQVLVLLKDLQRTDRLAWVLVTHDLGVVAQVADRVAILKQGVVVETADVKSLFAAPEQNYTRELLATVRGHGGLA